MDFVTQLFKTSDFPARWNCGAGWKATPAYGWMHVLSDLGIWSAYLAIPFVLGYFVLRRKDIPFRTIFVLFGAFILTCGTTHLMDALIFWWPAYRLAGVVKMVTALVSWATVFALVSVAPEALAMRSPEELEREIAGRRRAETDLLLAKADLERQVDARTAELKGAAEALRSERELLQTTLASIGDAVIATDAEGRVTFMNTVAEWMTGWSGAEAAGEALDEVFRIVNEESRRPVENPALRALKEGTIVGLANHTVLIARDGTERPIDDSAAPIRGVGGIVAGAVLVFRDISGRKKEEEEMRDARRRLQSTLAAAEIGTCVYDPVHNTVWADDNMARMFGVTKEQANGGPLEVFQKIIHPDDWDGLAKVIDEAAKYGETYEAEHRIITPDGGIRWVVARGRVERDDAGNVMRLPGVVVDVTGRKSAEEERQKFVALAENSTDFIAMWDLAGAPSYINRSGLTLIGLDDVQQARRTTVREFFFPEDQAKITGEFFAGVVRDGHGEIEVRFRNFKNGEARWMAYKVFTLADAKGVTIGLASVSQDVTERRRLEHDLRKLAADLSEVDHRKNEFLATLAHELRNPLAPIRNGLQLMRLSQGERGVVEQARTMMERQLTQMVRLVDDLMDVSRISRGKIGLRKERIELSTMLHSAVETSRPAIEQMGHELTVAQPDQPILLDADPVRLAQVFSNLLNNSAKYSERGGHIWLTATLDGPEVVVSVRDTGIGIAADQLHRVFDMFTQTDRALDRAQGGLGIGLTLVKNLVEMHGGSVQAKSDGPGRGSEFVVRLPVAAEADKPVAGEARETTAVAAPMHILIVDDNRDGADSLSMMLRAAGHEIRTAYDGEEAVAVAAEYRPDVILLDIGLPKLNGYEACRRIRREPWGREVAIIAQTGWGQNEDRRRTQEAGFDHHLVKPVDPTELLELLARLPRATARGRG